MEPNAILSESLSLSSDIPLYAQLVGIIKRSISSGALAIGDLLPSEAELCRALNVSRNTVRQAIGELEDEGLVVRKRGKGTFVADPNTNRRGVRYSFTTEVSSLGKTPSSTLRWCRPTAFTACCTMWASPPSPLRIPMRR